MLVVTIEKIETNRATGVLERACSRPTPSIPASIAARVDREPRRVNWLIDKAKGIGAARRRRHRPAIELPLRPMLGCVGVAPARKEAIATSTPGAFGGNMDYAGLTAGVKVMLPVNEPGALLFIGDGHARQGEGEVVGTGLETSMDVEFTRASSSRRSRSAGRASRTTRTSWCSAARARCSRRLQHATTEMQRWLMADYGFSERGASLLHGPGARIRDRQRRRSELHGGREDAQVDRWRA